MRLTKSNICAIAIDIQEKLTPVMYNSQKLIDRCLILTEGLKLFNTPTIVTEQYPKGLGKTIEKLQSLFPENAIYIDKTSFSCFGALKFITHFEAINKEYVIVYGIEAHVCVLQTVIDIIEHGKTPVIVADCASSRNELDMKYALDRMQALGAIITTTESLLFELCEDANSPEFKALSKLVK